MLRLTELMLAALNAVSKTQAWQSLSDSPKRCPPILRSCLECLRPAKQLLGH
jgi:hypothetical protein